jgi:hypothetical protein
MDTKHLSVATVIENRLSSDTPFLCAMDIEVVDPITGVVVEVIYLVRNSEDITYQGNAYVATSFDLDLKSEGGAVPTVSVAIKDFTKAIQGRMQAYGGGLGFNVTIYVVNAGNLLQPPEVVEFFQVIGAKAANYIVTFTLGAENAVAVTFPKRRQTKDFCQWRYKDPETCAYAGSLATCDLSLQGPNGCVVHENSPNFGGYPGISKNDGFQYG